VGLRIVLILWTLLVALSVPYLIELMGLIGNITGTFLSLIWPAYFHLKLREKSLTLEETRFDKLVIGLGIGICVIGVYYSAIELYSAITYESS
jgi:vesicular inhibitory amino acid transporter